MPVGRFQLRPQDLRAAADAIKDVPLDDGAEPQQVGAVGESLSRHPGAHDLWGLHRQDVEVAHQQRGIGRLPVLLAP